MKIPYYKQETNYTCGLASARMVLEALGIKRSEKQLARLLKTNTRVGTHFKYFTQLAERYHLDYIVGRNATIDDLEKALDERYLVIAGHYLPLPVEPDEHYSVILSIDRDYVYTHDPWCGPNQKRSRAFFRKWWEKHISKYEKEKGFFIGMKKS